MPTDNKHSLHMHKRTYHGTAGEEPRWLPLCLW